MSQEWKEVLDDGTELVRTCAWSPPGCHPVGCGLVLTVKDGKITKVEGDPQHPISQGRLCVRCLALRDYIYHEDRVVYPMKRAKEDRGKDKWERITWDEALDMIESEVRHIWKEWGPESIFVYSGTGRETSMYCWAMSYAILMSPHQVFSLSGLSCMGPRAAVTNYILGCGYPELDFAAYFPDRYDDPRYEIPKYIVLWGKNPLESYADGFYGHSIVDLMKRGSKLICIDPRVTWTSARAAYHLQLRPGTDAAVGLGLINIIIQEDLYDHDFVENWCYGFDELKERAAEFPPERVAEISWVDKDQLIGAARALGTSHPSSYVWGVAIDEGTYGVQGGHCMLDLAAITGNIDVPGGVTVAPSVSFMGKWRFDCVNELPEGVFAKSRITRDSYTAFNVERLESHPDETLNAMEEGRQPFKMAWFYGSNPLACIAQQPQRWLAQFMKNEFNVVQDTFINPTAAACCDLFLPVSTFAEHDGFVLPQFGRNTHFLGAINKAVEVGEARSDLEIDFMVGKRLNPKAWPWETVADFFTEQIHTQYDWDFEYMQNRVAWQQPYEYKKYEKGLMRPDGQPGFNTPTGLVELASSLYEDWGDDSLPYYHEPVLSPYSEEITEETKRAFPLVLTTGGRRIASFHSEHRQIAALRQFVPDPWIEIHPDTAAERGIADGDWVVAESPYGKALLKAMVHPATDPRVVMASHAWWFPEESSEYPNLFGVFKSNINMLLPTDLVGKFGYGAPVKSLICQVRKAETGDFGDVPVPPTVRNEEVLKGGCRHE